MKRLLLMLFPLMLAAPALAETVTLTVLSTNDFHGAIDGVEDPELAGKARWLGGAEYLASMVKKLRAEAHGPSILVDAGDCFQGQLAVNLAEGVPCVRLFDLVGYDVATLGNHEFDYLDCGPDTPGETPKRPRCALEHALAGSRHPVVIANVVDDAGTVALPNVRPYVVIPVGPIKVGVTGVLTPLTPIVSNPGGTAGLRFIDPVKAVRAVVPRMRAEGADVVVVLAHLTGSCPGEDAVPPGGATDCRVSGELGTLLQKLAGQVDLVAAGHSHVFLAGDQQPVQVMETHSQGRFVGRARLAVDTAAHRVVEVKVLAPAPVCRAEDPDSAVCSPHYAGFAGVVAPDPEVLRFREEVDRTVDAVCKDVVATAAEDIVHNRGHESQLADLTADLMREAGGVAHGGTGPADFAFVNLGSIRDSLRKGQVTMCDVHRIWPFEDRLVEVRMTGAQLRGVFRFVTGRLHKWFAISGGGARGSGPTLEILDAGGNPIDPGRVYRVVTSAYLLRGGDQIKTILSDVPPSDVRILDYRTQKDAFRSILGARGTVVPPPSGRIVP